MLTIRASFMIIHKVCQCLRLSVHKYAVSREKNETGHTHCRIHTHLEVLLKHGQFELFSALRIIWIHHDPLAHHVSCKDANAVLALGAHWLAVLEELLSQLVHLEVKVERQSLITREKNEEGCRWGKRKVEQAAPVSVASLFYANF